MTLRASVVVVYLLKQPLWRRNRPEIPDNRVGYYEELKPASPSGNDSPQLPAALTHFSATSALLITLKAVSRDLMPRLPTMMRVTKASCLPMNLRITTTMHGFLLTLLKRKMDVTSTILMRYLMVYLISARKESYVGGTWLVVECLVSTMVWY